MLVGARRWSFVVFYVLYRAFIPRRTASQSNSGNTHDESWLTVVLCSSQPPGWSVLLLLYLPTYLPTIERRMVGCCMRRWVCMRCGGRSFGFGVSVGVTVLVLFPLRVTRMKSRTRCWLDGVSILSTTCWSSVGVGVGRVYYLE